MKYLNKLRGRSLREWRERGRQELHKFGERLRLQRGVMSDEQWLRLIEPSFRNGSGEGTAQAILQRLQRAHDTQPGRDSVFLPALDQSREIAELMRTRFAAESAALIERADRICAGRFDLLGLRDLSFGTPPDWHLEPVSGCRTPLIHWSRIDYLNSQTAGDKKITWELNRHGYFITLGQAYRLTNDERYAAVVAAHIASWMEANPPQLGINWASSLEVSFRAVAWLWTLRLLAGSAHLTPALLRRMHKCLIAHGRHVARYLSEYFSPNTHLTGEALGLVYLGVALPELREAQAWRATGLAILRRELERQVRDDGVYFEQATYYHRYTTDFYLHLLLLDEWHGLRLPALVSERLTQMLDYLMWITRPDGASPLMGDDDGGRFISFSTRARNDFRETLATGAALFGRGDWKAVAGDAAVELLWLMGPEALRRYDELASQTPTAHTRAFTESGYYVMRDGWQRDAGYALIDGGPHGALSCGHAHADALALEFATDGRAWLVDPGTCTYTGDAKLRDLFRATAAHNTVTVDQVSQSVMAGPFAWRQHADSRVHDFIEADGFISFTGSHKGYERLPDPVTHQRQVIFVKAHQHRPAYLIVRDELQAAGRHDYSMRWHLPADCQAQVAGQVITAEDAAGRQLVISAVGTSPVQARIEGGQMSQAYGQREVAPVAVFEANGSGSQEFLSLILPARVSQPVTILPVNIKRQPGRGFSIASGTVVDVWWFSNGDNDSAERVERAGAVFCERYICGRLVQVCLLNRHELSSENGFYFFSPARVRYCALRIDDQQIEMVIDGTDRFELQLTHPVSRFVINGESPALIRQQPRTVFVFTGSKWQQVCA